LETEAIQKASFLAESSASYIDARLGKIQGLIQGIAIAMESRKPAASLDDVKAMLSEALLDNSEVYGICIAYLKDIAPVSWNDIAPYIHRQGQGSVYETPSADENAYISEDWFYLARYLDRPIWTEPYLETINGTTQVKMVSYSVPIHIQPSSGPVFAGVVTCDIELEWLDGVITNLPLGKDGYGILMSKNGTYISHPLKELVFNESVFSLAEARGDKSLRLTGQRVISGLPGIMDFVSFAKSEESWLAWQPLTTADWVVGTLISKAPLKTSVILLSRDEALVGFGGMIFLALAVWLIARSITGPVRSLGEAAGTLAGGNLDATLPKPRGNDEVAQLTIAFATMRDNLKAYIADLAETTAARERMNGELRIAHDIQMDLVPKTFPAFPERKDMDLFAVIEPAKEVGGDFYDFFMLDEDRIVLAIGDVSGKGVPAALFMAVTRSFLRSEFKVDADPGRVLYRVNDELSEGNESCMFVTLFCAVATLSDGSVSYANAGHNPPAVLRSTGAVEWIKKPRGPAAGAIPGSEYATGNFNLRAGEALLLYTDGVTEAMNHTSTLYGEVRLAAMLASMGNRLCREGLETLLADIRAHAAGAEQSDDITMLMFRRVAAESPDEGRHAMKLEFPNDPASLGGALDSLETWMERNSTAPGLIYTVRLTLEELGTNIIKYGYDDDAVHKILADIDLGPPVLLRIEDDGHPFDPTADAPAPDLEASVEDRSIGGLGLHMVRNMTAGMEYRREGNHNILRVEFKN
jgi:phosphoserine phosphatase RsbU/P